MRKKIQVTDERPTQALAALGEFIRALRKQQKLSAEVVAEASGISRITLHRIENGAPSVSAGAYASVLNALGTQITSEALAKGQFQIPEQVFVDQYAGLRQITWQLRPGTALTPSEAWHTYQAQWRHLDQNLLKESEIQLIDALELKFGPLYRV
ncbi:MAG: helix-turn-helix domain-containing protein [Micrococcales bacterium]